jgi:FMN phosphatase YigB (HAD superfamily)
LSQVFSPRLRLLACALVAVFVLGACDVDITVDVEVATDGSGVVEVQVVLDEEAAQRIPDLRSQLRLDDLVAADWLIVGPEETPDDGIEITARKTFDGPEQLQAVLDDITGPDGAFQDFTLSRATEFAQVDLDLAGTVDLSRGLALFTDAELVEALDGRPLGVDLDALEAEIGPAADAVDFTFRVRLPGSTEDSAEGAEVSVSPALGDPPVPVSLSTTDEDGLAKILRLVGLAAAALAAVAMLINLVIWIVEWRRRRLVPDIVTPEPVRPVPAPMALATAGTSAGTSYAGSGGYGRSGPRLALVVVDANGVLYEPLLGPLVTFVKARGSTLDRAEITALYDEACEGRRSTAELWSDAGVSGDPAELDVAFLSTVRVRSGATDFVRELRRRGMQVGAIGNTVSPWSNALRARDGLADVEPWVASSDAGVTTPHPGLYEALRRATGVPFEDWLIIHADLESLDAAKTLGMSTVWFTRELPPANQRPPHALVAGFADFFKRR